MALNRKKMVILCIQWGQPSLYWILCSLFNNITIYTINITLLKQSIPLINAKPLTWNDSNVTFNHIHYSHAWTGLLWSALQRGRLYCAVVWMQISPSIIQYWIPVLKWASASHCHPASSVMDSMHFVERPQRFCFQHYADCLREHVIYCSRGAFIVFSCGLKAALDDFLFLPRMETNRCRNKDIMASIQNFIFCPQKPLSVKFYCWYPILGVLVNHVLSLSFEI